MSSIGSVPQPNSNFNSVNNGGLFFQQYPVQNGNISSHVLPMQSSQSVPSQFTNYSNNQYITTNAPPSKVVNAHPMQYNGVQNNGHPSASAPNPPIHSISANGYPSRTRASSHTQADSLQPVAFIHSASNSVTSA